MQRFIQDLKNSIYHQLSRLGRLPEKGSTNKDWIDHWTIHQINMRKDVRLLDQIIHYCQHMKEIKESTIAKYEEYIQDPPKGIKEEITALKERNKKKHEKAEE